MTRSALGGLLLMLAAGSCGSEARNADSTATTEANATEPAGVAIEDDRCEPAVEFIDDPDYGLVNVTSDIDIGDGQGPSDEVVCTFLLQAPPKDTEQKQVRNVVVAADGSASER